ncbi:MAG: ATP-binding protein [Candidatus Peribacteraceae bacterium]|nr:ATP-binding protein [Candidatus Peribacteraceae bacterium]
MKPKQTATAKGQSDRYLLLVAAIDDLLGLHKRTTATLRNIQPGEELSTDERSILQRYEEGLQKTMDLIAPAGMEIRNDQIVLNERHARTLYVHNWPNYLYPNWLSSVINFDAEMEIAQYIYPSSNKIIMKMLRKKVTEMRSSIRMLEQRGIVRDPVLEAALQDAEELRDLLARGREKLFQFGMYITLYADDSQSLKKLETDIESLLGGKLVLTKPAMFQMEHAWISTLPLCQDELVINRNMNTSPLATSFPFSSSDLTDDHGILYGINRHNDSLVIFDRFDLPNANATVFATSGAGKSFTVKLEILRSLMFQTDVFVVDPENEYVELSQAVGGTHIPVSLQSSYRINPFDLPKAVRGEEAEKGETLRAAVITLHGLFKLMLGTLTPAEDGILDKAILDTYALKNIKMDSENPQDLEPPTMHELVDVLSTTDGGEHMAQTLKKYTEGSFSGIFDQQTNIELNNQMIVFQIRDLEDQLRPIAMYVILNFLWNRIRADFKRRLLVIDEAWNLMQHEDSARFLYGLIKRARKYYLGITTITQDIEDFVNSPYGKPIITNASLQILLKQSASAIDNLQKLFYLTDGEKYLLLNSDVGQGLFFAGNKHVAIQIVASPQEEKLITTKPEEVLEKRKEKELLSQEQKMQNPTEEDAREQERVTKAVTEKEQKENTAAEVGKMVTEKAGRQKQPANTAKQPAPGKPSDKEQKEQTEEPTAIPADESDNPTEGKEEDVSPQPETARKEGRVPLLEVVQSLKQPAEESAKRQMQLEKEDKKSEEVFDAYEAEQEEPTEAGPAQEEPQEEKIPSEKGEGTDTTEKNPYLTMQKKPKTEGEQPETENA